MSLLIDFELRNSQNCETFGVVDTTGVYNASTNPGGYGSPNPAIADIVEADIRLSLPNGTTQDLNEAGGFVYPTLPNTDGTPYTVTATLLGIASPMVDWISLMTYTVTDDEDNVYTKTKYVAITCNAECCVANLLAQVDFHAKCDPCDNKNLQLWIRANSMLKAIYNALDCSTPMPNKAAEILNTLTSLCAANGCAPCSSC